MSLLLSSLRPMFSGIGRKQVIFGTGEFALKTWRGRFVSSHTLDCSKKCAQFNPNKPCCCVDSDDEIEEVLINPAFAWHPLSVHHPFVTPKKKEMPVSQKTPDSSLKETNSQKTPELTDSSSKETNFATDHYISGFDVGNDVEE